jgi:predicted RNA-binding protein Jag
MQRGWAEEASAVINVADYRGKRRENLAGYRQPGGSRIITTVLQMVVNSIDFGMNVAEAKRAALPSSVVAR